MSPWLVRSVGVLLASTAFLLFLFAGPFGEDELAAWGLATVVSAAVIGVVLIVVRVASSTAEQEPGRLTADYLVILAGTVGVAVLGYPTAALVVLLTEAV